MKRYVLFFLMLIKVTYAAPSDTLESLYQQGAYQEIIDTHEPRDNNAATWLMMGNAAYCLHKYNEAYLYWLRAQRYGNAHSYYTSRENMHLLHAHGFVAPEHNVYTWLIWLSKYVGIYILQMLFVAVWYLLCVMLYKRYRPFFVRGVILLASSLLVPIVATYYFHQEKGLVMEDATIYNGPNSAYYNVGSVPKGALINIKNVQGDWVKIIYNDTIGWIGRTDVGLLGIREFETKASGTSALRKEN